MKRDDMTAKSDRAARTGGALVMGATLQVAMPSNPGAMIRPRGVSA